jgi:RHS repeat-associated protein
VADPKVRDEATVVVPGGSASGTFTYDVNGNLTSDGVRTFEWDAENRLVAVVKGTHRSEFVYDGMSRRTGIIEKDNGTVTTSKKYVWDGTEIAEERDSTGAMVTKKFYAQGFVDTDATNLYYTRDHLGSIRELTDSTQVIRARYDYDPYGRVAKASGDRDSVFQFTGYFWHAQSSLSLALFRAYDPNLGRWISRDPIGEKDNVNLYAYISSDPLNGVDPLGLSRCFKLMYIPLGFENTGKKKFITEVLPWTVNPSGLIPWSSGFSYDPLDFYLVKITAIGHFRYKYLVLIRCDNNRPVECGEGSYNWHWQIEYGDENETKDVGYGIIKKTKGLTPAPITTKEY